MAMPSRPLSLLSVTSAIVSSGSTCPVAGFTRLTRPLRSVTQMKLSGPHTSSQMVLRLEARAEAVTVVVPTAKVVRAGAWAQAASGSPRVTRANNALRIDFMAIGRR